MSRPHSVAATATAVLGLLAGPAHAGPARAPATASAAPVNGTLGMWWTSADPIRSTSFLTWGAPPIAHATRTRTRRRPAAPRSAYRLPAWSQSRLLDTFVKPSVERAPKHRSFVSGSYGYRGIAWLPPLQWSTRNCSIAKPVESQPRGFEDVALRAPAPMSSPALSDQLIPTWSLVDIPAPDPELANVEQRQRCDTHADFKPVTLARYGGEYETFRLLECDGSISADALERLSVFARPPGVPRPKLPLPMEPGPKAATTGEWIPGVKVLHPRLGWALQMVGEKFPNRPIYIISGYRQDAHTSYHTKGRALDLLVMGVPNEELFKFCHKLRDVACGFYPNNTFVHLDIRSPGSNHPMWIDTAAPGAGVNYVDAWPGVVDSGALAWAGGE